VTVRFRDFSASTMETPFIKQMPNTEDASSYKNKKCAPTYLSSKGVLATDRKLVLVVGPFLKEAQ
jgi:hypothetical protein